MAHPVYAPRIYTRKVNRKPGRFFIYFSTIKTARDVAGLKCAPETLYATIQKIKKTKGLAY